ncbi:MAG: AraC family transcriptional regulator [Muribaculaceae bacterium]|nr:AraC family transcriptional regulator [Muribaculaceae bacterium]
MKKGLEFAYSTQQMDSALVYLSVVSSRVRGKESDLSVQDAEMAARALRMSGQLYLLVYNDKTKSVIQLLRAVDLAQKYGLENELILAKFNLVNIQYMENLLSRYPEQMKKVLDEYKSILDLSLKQGNNKTTDYLVCNIAIIAFSYGELAEVEPTLMNYFKLKERSEWCGNLIKSMLEWDKGNHKEAFSLLDKAEQDVDEPNDANRAVIYKVIAQVRAIMYLKEDRLTEAKKILNSLIKESLENKDYFQSFEAYSLLRNYYDEKNCTDSAQYYELLMYRNSDSFQSQLPLIEGPKNILEIEKLQDKTAVLTTAGRMYRYIIVIIAIFSVLLIVMLILLFYKFRQVRKNEQLLFRRSEELAKTSPRAVRINVEDTKSENADEEAAGNKVYRKVLEIMDNNDEVFSVNFSAARLAELVGEKQSVVAAAIQENSNLNFSTLLAQTRIKEACRRMSDEDNYGMYTIEGIAQSVGYKSRPYFVAIFKKSVGISPSEYIRQARKSKNKGSGVYS